MVWQALVVLYFYSFIIPNNAVESGINTNVSNNKPNISTNIEVTSVIDISDTLLVPIRLEILDEINIDVNAEDNKTQYKNRNDKQSYVDGIHPPSTTQKVSTEKIMNQTIPKCCLIISPPKCDEKQCVIRRKKVCWNICTNRIIIREAPGFPKEKFPKEFIPSKWQTEPFTENLIITLVEPKTENLIGDNSKQPYFYQNNPPLPYFYQNFANPYDQPIYYNPYYQNFYGQLPGYYNPHPGHF